MATQRPTITRTVRALIAANATPDNLRTHVGKLPAATRRALAADTLEGYRAVLRAFVTTYKAKAAKARKAADKAEARAKKAQDAATAKALGIRVKYLPKVRDNADRLTKTLRSGHIMGCLVTVKATGPKGRKITAAEFDTRSAYSGRASRYQAAHGYVDAEVPVSDLLAAEVIGGIVTIMGPSVALGIRRATWYRDGGSYYAPRLEKVEGYVTGEYHEKTLDIAKWHRAMEVNRAKRNKAKAADQKARLGAVAGKFVGFAHVRAAGCCADGIAAWAKEAGLNIEHGYTVGYLVELAAGTWAAPFVARLIP